MKKVLIAIDYNPTAEKVAQTGYEMAKAMDAETTLLHVISDPIYYSTAEYSSIMGFTGYSDITTLSLENAIELKKYTQDFLNHTKMHLKNDDIQTLIKEGDFADSILEAAKEIKADIIVLGSHSRRWLEDVFLGSVTEKVLKKSKIPLFIIPTKKRK
jgi:nucleotide-binding universal stress UspA family protein